MQTGTVIKSSALQCSAPLFLTSLGFNYFAVLESAERRNFGVLIDSCFESIFTEEGYDGGESPEPLVNVTAVPLVSEILQVWILFLNQCMLFIQFLMYLA